MCSSMYNHHAALSYSSHSFEYSVPQVLIECLRCALCPEVWRGKSEKDRACSLPSPSPVGKRDKRGNPCRTGRGEDAKEGCLEEVAPELSHETVGALAASGVEAEGLGQRARVGFRTRLLTPTP